MYDTSTCINTSLGCFPEIMLTPHVQSTITYQFITYIGVTALFIGLTMETMSSLHILHIYLTHDCINCLQWCYIASKHRIAVLNFKYA